MFKYVNFFFDKCVFYSARNYDFKVIHEMWSILLDDLLVFVYFRWSQDGAYVARAANECLSVYESPSFGLLEKKSIKIPGLKDFSWSPDQKFIAYWVPEDKDAPARVCIMEMPARTEIRVKNLFNVHDVSILVITMLDLFFICIH